MQMKYKKTVLMLIATCVLLLALMLPVAQIIFRTQSFRKVIVQMIEDRQPMSNFEQIFEKHKVHGGNLPERMHFLLESPISERQGLVRFAYEGIPSFSVILVYDIDTGETEWVKIF